MSLQREINEYLACEFGLEDAEISEESPFVLTEQGTVRSAPIFLFRDEGEDYYAWGGDCLQFLPVAGMSLEDLEYQDAGAALIAAQNPINLATSMPGEPGVPSGVERRKAIDAMCSAAGLGGAAILEGLFLRDSGAYLALVQAGPDAIAIHSAGGQKTVGFNGASPWRRLAWAAATLLSVGE